MAKIHILKNTCLVQNVYGKFHIDHLKYISQKKYGFANMDFFKIRIYKYGFFCVNTYLTQNMDLYEYGFSYHVQFGKYIFYQIHILDT